MEVAEAARQRPVALNGMAVLMDLLPDGDDRARRVLSLADHILKSEPDRYVREATYALLHALPGPRDLALEQLAKARKARLPD